MQEAISPAASQGTLGVFPKGTRIPISVLEVWPNHGRAAAMFKYFRRAWDFVVVCVRVHHVYELLRDYFDGL